VVGRTLPFSGGGVEGPDVAVDLGTANTLVYVRGRGVVLFEPSVVAVDERTGRVCAVGAEAKRMLGRTPAHITATRPLADGRISEVEVAQQMLRHFLARAHPVRWGRPRVVVCIPSGLTGVERAAVAEATYQAGARAAALIEEPMAAALGAGLPVAEPEASLVVDVGGGTSEMAVIALGGVVAGGSIRVGGDALDEAIAGYIRQRYNFVVGAQSAEQLKLQVGSAWPRSAVGEAEAHGRHLASGKASTVRLEPDEMLPVLEPALAQICEAVSATLEATPPELAADLIPRGITLAGGGALLPGLDQRLGHATGLPVRLAESPLTCVVLGAGSALDSLLARPVPAGLRAGRRAARSRRRRLPWQAAG
jgi:rod shape-determining protein MreB and related proteins